MEKKFVGLTTNKTGTKLYFVFDDDALGENEWNCPMYSTVVSNSMKRRIQMARRAFRSLRGCNAEGKPVVR